MKKVIYSIPTAVVTGLFVFLVTNRSQINPYTALILASLFSVLFVLELDLLWEIGIKITDATTKNLIKNLIASILTILILTSSPSLIMWLFNQIMPQPIFISNNVSSYYCAGLGVSFAWFWTRFFTKTLTLPANQGAQ